MNMILMIIVMIMTINHMFTSSNIFLTHQLLMAWLSMGPTASASPESKITKLKNHVWFGHLDRLGSEPADLPNLNRHASRIHWLKTVVRRILLLGILNYIELPILGQNEDPRAVLVQAKPLCPFCRLTILPLLHVTVLVFFHRIMWRI